MAQPTLEEILEAIRTYGENNDQQALMGVAEAVQEAVELCKTEESEEEEEDEDSESESESDEDDNEVEISNVEEVEHLTTLQLMALGNSVTHELTNRALAAEEEDDVPQDGSDSEDDEND